MCTRDLSFLSVSAVLCISLWLLGCTAIGHSIGSSIDDNNANSDTLRGRTVVEVKPGTGVRVVTKDGSTYLGSFRGVGTASLALYQHEYRYWRDSCTTCQLVPQIGDSVTLIPGSAGGQIVSGEFVGFTLIAVALRHKSSNPSLEGPVIRAYRFESIDRLVDSHGRSVTSADLRKTLSDNNAPSDQCLELLATNGIVQIPVGKVEKVITEPQVPSTGKTIGTVVGLGLDLAVVASVILLVALANTF